MELNLQTKLNPDLIKDQLNKSGHILYRGLNIETDEKFRNAISNTGLKMTPYLGGSTDRNSLSENVYEATPVPGHVMIPLHSEMSYSSLYPRWIFFYCHKPSKQGGETTLVDNREVLKSLPLPLVKNFEEKQLLVWRKMHHFSKWKKMITSILKDSLIKSWQETYLTNDINTVNSFLDENKIEYKWTNQGLEIKEYLPATRSHPDTNDQVWFNQAPIFSPTKNVFPFLVNLVRNLIIGKGDDAKLGCKYGNGQGIEREFIDTIFSTTQELMTPVKWQKGDFLIIDNILCGHGRLPFRGHRDIRVAMGRDIT